MRVCVVYIILIFSPMCTAEALVFEKIGAVCTTGEAKEIGLREAKDVYPLKVNRFISQYRDHLTNKSNDKQSSWISTGYAGKNEYSKKYEKPDLIIQYNFDYKKIIKNGKSAGIWEALRVYMNINCEVLDVKHFNIDSSTFIYN